MAEDYHAILGVSPDASQDEIRKAYRELAFRCHPDRCDDPDVATKFKAIQNAYEMLIEPEKHKPKVAFHTVMSLFLTVWSSPRRHNIDSTTFGNNWAPPVLGIATMGWLCIVCIIGLTSMPPISEMIPGTSFDDAIDESTPAPVDLPHRQAGQVNASPPDSIATPISEPVPGMSFDNTLDEDAQVPADFQHRQAGPMKRSSSDSTATPIFGVVTVVYVIIVLVVLANWPRR